MPNGLKDVESAGEEGERAVEVAHFVEKFAGEEEALDVERVEGEDVEDGLHLVGGNALSKRLRRRRGELITLQFQVRL